MNNLSYWKVFAASFNHAKIYEKEVDVFFNPNSRPYCVCRTMSNPYFIIRYQPWLEQTSTRKNANISVTDRHGLVGDAMVTLGWGYTLQGLNARGHWEASQQHAPLHDLSHFVPPQVSYWYQFSLERLHASLICNK